MSLVLNRPYAHDPGGRVRMVLQVGVDSDAIFSPCGRYRQTLWRRWDPLKSTMAVVGMNPSTADQTCDDPTIRKLIGFARREGHGSLLMLNAMDYRSTDPRGLLAPGVAPCSPDNHDIVRAHLRALPQGSRVVAAWGRPPKPVWRHLGQMIDLLRAQPHPVRCFGRTREGFPRHPLYLPNAARLEPFP